MTWETVIGLEVHAQLSTKSKLFSGAATTFGATPNTQTSYIDAALPGVLPVLNEKAVHMAIQFGLAVNATIHRHSYFERKNYVYPDLPKGYQISQHRDPIVSDGILGIHLPNNKQKFVTIVRAHLEEDAGKLIHHPHHGQSIIDLNRAGNPLLEIVTSPCLYSAEETIIYLKTLHQLLRFLNICDGNMQEGSFRCDVNISLRPRGEATLGTRTELKNLNSFRFIEKAIAYEQQRHRSLLESGNTIQQETRLYDPDKNITRAMREKEKIDDYRYFPDPDLLPITVSTDTLTYLQQTLPELPTAIRKRLSHNYGLLEEDITLLLSSTSMLFLFDSIVATTSASIKTVINWLKGPYLAILKENNLTPETNPISANDIALLLNYLEKNKISLAMAKKAFSEALTTSNSIPIVLNNDQFQLNKNTDELADIIDLIITQHPQQVAEYRAGKEKLLSFFIGKVMKAAHGKADAAEICTILKSKVLL